MMTNCPNCGAPIKSHQCEYCGTLFGHKLSDVERLQIENEELKRRISIEHLYTEALNAMRNYSKF